MKKLVLSALLLAFSGIANAAGVLEVHKSPYCGCCTDWVDHMRENGFEVKVHETENLQPVKQRAGIQPGQGSCHTAFIDGYSIEGHVPASDVRKLLEQKPDARGLAVPGMPVGSPGMEVEGRPADNYEVILFRDNGDNEVFARH